MPLSLWRLIKAKHARTALSGDGARRYGGRWNERGSAIVYLGGTLSLAALETFVHLTAADVHLSFAAIEVLVADDIPIGELDDLPTNWREEPPPGEMKALGSAWARAGETALLRVPSVIVPRESNYLLDPAHPDFGRFTVLPPQPFGFDQRMWK